VRASQADFALIRAAVEQVDVRPLQVLIADANGSSRGAVALHLRCAQPTRLGFDAECPARRG
jgi:hypothetical protein